METKLEDVLRKIADKKPEIKAKLDELSEKKKQLAKFYEIDSEENITVDGKPAKLRLFKRGIVEIHFRDIVEAKQAIEKLKA